MKFGSVQCLLCIWKTLIEINRNLIRYKQKRNGDFLKNIKKIRLLRLKQKIENVRGFKVKTKKLNEITHQQTN